MDDILCVRAILEVVAMNDAINLPVIMRQASSSRPDGDLRIGTTSVQLENSLCIVTRTNNDRIRSSACACHRMVLLGSASLGLARFNAF